MGLSYLRMDGCLGVPKHAAPHLLGYHARFGHLVKPYDRNFEYLLRSRLSKVTQGHWYWHWSIAYPLSGGNSGTNIMQMCTKMHDFLCKISIFSGWWHPRNSLPHLPPHRGMHCTPRPGRRSSARHPNVEHKPAPMRSTIGASFDRRRSSISGYWSSALKHFTVRGDVGAIHGNLLLRRRLKTYLFTQSYSGKHMLWLVFYCFNVLFTVLQWYLQYFCSVTF